MTTDRNYIAINKQSWNSRVDLHLKSGFYDLQGFLNGKSSLNDIELQLLENINGKSVLHLQCHFGQDTISLARLGAIVTGVDLSDKAIDTAKKLAIQTGADASFICCNIYDLPDYLNGQFDIVFTSYGAIPWLPDLKRWAKVISAFLKPHGRFILVEFHPVVWMFDENFKEVSYSYFNSGAICETEQGTYAGKNADIVLESVNWNHSLSEVVNSLIQNGLQIKRLDEFDYSPYNVFSNAIEVEAKKYRIAHLPGKIPITYAIEAIAAPL